jgi:hypothetical protein
MFAFQIKETGEKYLPVNQKSRPTQQGEDDDKHEENSGA